jgi:hypothetical protein
MELFADRLWPPARGSGWAIIPDDSRARTFGLLYPAEVETLVDDLFLLFDDVPDFEADDEAARESRDDVDSPPARGGKLGTAGDRWSNGETAGGGEYLEAIVERRLRGLDDGECCFRALCGSGGG